MNSKYIRVHALTEGNVPCASKSSKKGVVNSAWNAGHLLRRDAMCRDLKSLLELLYKVQREPRGTEAGLGEGHCHCPPEVPLPLAG